MHCDACSAELETSGWSCSCGNFRLCSIECTDDSTSILHRLHCGHDEPGFVSAVFEASGSAAAPDSSTASKVTTLRRLLSAKITKRQRATRLEDVREAFEAVFPINEYPFKVMGFNRVTGRVIPLNKERTLALATMFPHQQLVRDCRAPYISDEGAIIIAPPGAGKTVMCHAILANYSRQLIKIRTPLDYYLNPNRSKPSAKSFENDEYQHRILIYVTKANLVGDVAKDVWAQNARSRELFERMMNDARSKDQSRISQNSFRYSDTVNGKYTFARFDKRVNVMSFREFGNMLLGANAKGRNLWAGRNLDDKDYLLPIKLDESVRYSGKTPVPVAYWKDENENYVRGNRPHNFMQALVDKDYNLSIRVPLKAALAASEMNRLRPALVKALLSTVNSAPLFKRAGVAGIRPLESAVFSLSHKPFSANTGTKKRPSNTVVLHIVSSKLQWSANLLTKISDKQWEQFISSNEFQDAVLTVFRDFPSVPRNSVEIRPVFQVFPADDATKRGWVLQKEGKKNYRWVPSDTGDYEMFNPIDRLVVVFDEGHLLFSPDNLLKSEESFDSNLIIQAFRESNGVAYYASATVDVITGIRMAQSLTPLPSFKGASEERRRDDDLFPEYEGDADSFLDAVEANQEQLGAALAGKINIVDVSGMRDLFPDKLISDELNVRYEINSEHARLILGSLGESVSRLMNAINVPVRLEEKHRLYTSLFDPDALLIDLFGPGNIYGFPLGKALLRAMRQVDDGLPIEMLTGRGIICTGLIDDTVTVIAGLMQALGYEWKYLIPKKLTPEELETKRRMRAGEYVPLALRSVHFDPQGPMSTRHASDDVIRSLGLEDLRAVPSLIDNKMVQPIFVVLSNDMLVSRDEQTALTDTASFARAALTDDRFSLPFRVRNPNSLREFGASELLRAEFRGTSRPVLHYYPANEEARAKAVIQLGLGGGLADLFSQGYEQPFFFIETKDEERRRSYQRVVFHGQPGGPLAVDPASFTRESLEPVATEYAKMKDDFKSDARELIRQTFNGGLAAMRKSNLRHILISRQYGQGIDVFNTNEVFRTEPAPDPATDEQGVGRFSRLGSAIEQPYDQQVVRYHTFVATYSKEVRSRDKIRGTNDALYPILQSLDGRKDVQLVLKSVNADPLEALKQPSGKSFKPKRALLPFQAVRVLTENPATTLRRAQMFESTLKSWAVDLNYNKPERETEPDPVDKVYSPTNYVLPTVWLKNRVAEFAPEPVETEGEDDVDWLLDPDRQGAAELHTLRMRQAAEYEKLVAMLDQDSVLQITRRLALHSEDRTLVVQLQNNDELVNLEIPIPGTSVRSLGQLRWLVENGIARFDPGFANISTAKAKRKVASKRSPPAAADEAAKRQRPDETGADPMVLAYRLPSLIGVAADARSTVTAENVHSIGIAVDRVAAQDQEQQPLEEATLRRMKVLCTALGLWVEHGLDNPEEIVAAVYKRFLGATGDGNPFRLRASVLLLFEHGLLTLPRALSTLARGLLSYTQAYTHSLGPRERTKFFDHLGVEMGQLYQLSFAADSVSELDIAGDDPGQAREAWSEPLDRIKRAVSVDIDDYEQRRALIRMMHMICCSIRSSISLAELSLFLERCFTSFRLGDRGQQRKTIVLNLNKALEKLPQDKRFTLVDVFGLMIGSLAVSARRDLEVLHRKMTEISSWDVIAEPPKSKQPQLEVLLAAKLSNGQYKEVEGLTREEMFDVVWTKSQQIGENWPIQRWVGRVATELRIPHQLALQRFREIVLSVPSVARLETGFKALLDEARPESLAPSYSFSEEEEEIVPQSGFLEERPLTYHASKDESASVFFSAMTQTYRWLTGGSEGPVESPVTLLVNSVRDVYPQLRVTDEATSSWLFTDPFLGRLSSALSESFDGYSDRFRQDLFDQNNVLKLLKARPSRVAYIRSLFRDSAIGIGPFLRIVYSSLSNLGPLIAFLHQVRASSAIADLAHLVPVEDLLLELPSPLSRAVVVLLDLPGLSSHFEALTSRITVVCNLFAIDPPTVVRFLVKAWEDSPDRAQLPFDELVQLSLPAVVAELSNVLRETLRTMDETPEQLSSPPPEEEEELPEDLGDERGDIPFVTPPVPSPDEDDTMQEDRPSTPVLLDVEPRPAPVPEVVVIDDDDEDYYPAPAPPDRITIDAKLRKILQLTTQNDL